MQRVGDLLTKHKNAFLISLLILTLSFGFLSGANDSMPTVDIPVTDVFSQQGSPLTVFRQNRDASSLADLAALERLLSKPDLDAATRDTARSALQALIDTRQAQTAIEGALCNSSLYPCTAVLSGGSLTIVTEKADISEKDSARVMTLAAAHAGISPENVRIVTAE